MSTSNHLERFRARTFASNGCKCEEYLLTLRNVPSESSLHRLFRDSTAAWQEHRFKYRLNLEALNVHGESGEIPMESSYYSKFINDPKGCEVLGPGAILGLLRLHNVTTMRTFATNRS